MSAEVRPAELAEVVAGFGAAYLLTVSDDGRPNVSAVRPRVDGGAVHVAGAGPRSRGNLAARPQATLLWPPAEDGGYSLILDGRVADAAGDPLVVTVGRAVLHRPAPPAGAPATPGVGICGSDCLPVGVPAAD